MKLPPMQLGRASLLQCMTLELAHRDSHRRLELASGFGALQTCTGPCLDRGRSD
jgi:hypothetical protein